MNPLTEEWVAKAEGDFKTAQRELSAAEDANYDAVCFHSQQCAEKYLKARLVEAGLSFSKTHDLGIVLDLLGPVEPGWEQMRPELNSLTNLAVEIRYPGCCSDAEDASKAIEVARSVRKIVRQSLGLTL